MFRRFVLAARFLTRLPVPGPCADFSELGKAASCFPFVGLLVGGLVAAAGVSVSLVWHSPLLGGVAAVIANALVTGGLHLDGLMDTCDGIFGGHTRERALEIMRDSRVGAFGALGGCIAILVRCGLSSGPEDVRWQALLLAPAIGRCAQVWAVTCFPYARPQGLGSAVSGTAGRWQVASATVGALLLCAAVARANGLAWLAAGWLGGGFIAWRIHRRLGGLTGDSYGAVTEVAEWTALASAWLLPAR